MPKKTRQEKIVAQLKRLQQQQSTQPAEKNTVGDSTAKPIPTIQLNLESLNKDKITSKIPEKQITYDYSYVARDLRKSLIFAVVAIVFEIVLSQLV